MFFKDTRNPKGPRECDYVRFLYTALPKRSALLLVGEGCVGVAFFLSHVLVSLMKQVVNI